MHIASQTLAHAPLAASTTASRMSGGVPGGSIASIFAITESVPRSILALSKVDWALSPVLGARSPPRRFVYRLGKQRGALALFGALNRSLVQRTAGLLALARIERESKQAQTELPPSYGPAFTYTEFMPTGGTVSAFITSFVFVIVFLSLVLVAPVCLVPSHLYSCCDITSYCCLCVSQIRWLTKRLVTQPGSGPADQ